MAYQPDVAVVDKHQRTAVVVDVIIPSKGNIRKKEHEKLEKYQGRAGKHVECEGSGSASINQGTGCCNPQDGLLAQADTRNNLRDLGPEERIAGKKLRS